MLSNAIKFAHVESQITVSLVYLQEFLEVSVLDFGVGIAPDEVDRIFEQFYRVRNRLSKSLNPNGNGIGLNISKRICQLFEGDLVCDSLQNSWTLMKFKFKIPKKSSRSTLLTSKKSSIGPYNSVSSKKFHFQALDKANQLTSILKREDEEEFEIQ